MPARYQKRCPRGSSLVGREDCKQCCPMLSVRILSSILSRCDTPNCDVGKASCLSPANRIASASIIDSRAKQWSCHQRDRSIPNQLSHWHSKPHMLVPSTSVLENCRCCQWERGNRDGQRSSRMNQETCSIARKESVIVLKHAQRKHRYIAGT